MGPWVPEHPDVHQKPIKGWHQCRAVVSALQRMSIRPQSQKHPGPSGLRALTRMVSAEASNLMAKKVPLSGSKNGLLSFIIAYMCMI
jgi:hypothetical protein